MLKRAFYPGLIVATLGLAFFFWQSALWTRAAHMVNHELKPLSSSASSETGPILLEPDSYLWLTYARRVATGETWRVRWTKTDNAPEGRPVHWSQSVTWGLVVAAKIRQCFFPDDSLQTSLEKASVWWNPFLFAVFAALIFFVVGKSISWWIAGAAVFVMSSLGDVLWAFQPLRPDHQTFHLLFGFATLLFAWPPFSDAIISGKITLRDRAWMLASAFSAGAGLWVSATVQSFFLLALAASSLLFLLLTAPPSTNSPEHTRKLMRLWREWGVLAASTSLVFYLLEYGPSLPWSRLEVNHPLYAISALALGWGLSSATVLKLSPDARQRPAVWLVLVGCIGAVLLPLALLLKSPPELHTIRTVEMLRFHNFIKEFYLYTNFVKGRALEHFFRSYGLLPLGLLAGPWLLWQRPSSRNLEIWLIGLTVTTTGFLMLGLFQLRWISVFAAWLALLAVVSFGTLWLSSPSRIQRVLAGITLFLVLCQTLYLMRAQSKEITEMLAGRTIITDLLKPAFVKHTALQLGSAQPPPTAILADPNYAPAIAYFSGIPTVVSFYWENLEGLRTAISIFAGTDDERSLQMLQERGISHILIEPSDYLPNVFYFIRHGHYDLEEAKQTLAGRILYQRGPPWLVNDTALTIRASGRFRYRTELLEHPVLIFKVVPE